MEWRDGRRRTGERGIEGWRGKGGDRLCPFARISAGAHGPAVWIVYDERPSSECR